MSTDRLAVNRADRPQRIHQLDGIRGAAVALVLLGHARVGTAAPVGVTIFFVLSGYLITGLLVSEQQRTGRVDLRAFYRRRIARLAPALLVVVAVVGVISFIGGARDTTVGALASLTYAANWIMAGGQSLGAMDHTWSLSVEEQFYFVWPVLFLLLPWRRSALVVLIVAVIGLRFASGIEFSEWRTQMRADPLLMGCLLALIPWRASRPMAAAGAAVLVIASAASSWNDPALGYTLTALASVALVAGFAHAPRIAPLEHLGRISYGVYLWHPPLYVALGPLLGIPASLLIAEASFRWLEEPLRRHLTATRPREAPADLSSLVPAPAKSAGSV